MDSRIGIKFHTDSSLTIGCIELFDFQKESLDFYIKNYFPIYFKLHKLKLGGYCIDFTDPLLKALTAEIEQKD